MAGHKNASIIEYFKSIGVTKLTWNLQSHATRSDISSRSGHFINEVTQQGQLLKQRPTGHNAHLSEQL